MSETGGRVGLGQQSRLGVRPRTQRSDAHSVSQSDPREPREPRERGLTTWALVR
jgi:hypothetical protein